MHFADVALFLIGKEPFELVMPNPAPFSSPPLRLYARSAGIEIGDDWPSWAPPALWNTAPGSSPFKAVERIVKHGDERRVPLASAAAAAAGSTRAAQRQKSSRSRARRRARACLHTSSHACQRSCLASDHAQPGAGIASVGLGMWLRPVTCLCTCTRGRPVR